MNTPAHVLLAAAMLARPNAPKRNTAVVAGAIMPDAMMFVMVGWERWINGLGFEQIFREAYYSIFWQEIFAINNSVPVFCLMLIAGLVWKVEWLWVFAVAALCHALLDLPLHHDDGHPHFWPFSNWIYESSVSYWDPRHHGVAAGWAEAILSTAMAILLWVRFKGSVARFIICSVLIIELLFSVGGHIIYGAGAFLN